MPNPGKPEISSRQFKITIANSPELYAILISSCFEKLYLFYLAALIWCGYITRLNNKSNNFPPWRFAI